VTNGLIGWWPADGHTEELIFGNDGELIAGATYGPGKVGQAFRFDGLDDYVEVPDNDLWTFGGNDFTISLWVNFHALERAEGERNQFVLIGQSEMPGEYNKWWFVLEEWEWTFHINDPYLWPPPFLVRSPFVPTLDQWYHLAARRADDTFMISVDGRVIGSEVYSDVIPNATAPLTIGQAESAGYPENNFLNGLVDEVMIYDRALSDEEINTIHAADTLDACKRLVSEGTQLPAPSSAPEAILSGRVTDAATGEGIAGATVKALLLEDTETGPQAITDPNGNYTFFDLPSGDYTVRVTASYYAREYFDNVVPSRKASVIHLPVSDGTLVVDFNLTESGSISGAVYESDGITPVAGAEVVAKPSGYEFDDGFHAVTDSEGSYKIEGVALGTYNVGARAVGREEQWYDETNYDLAADVAVTPPESVTRVDFRLMRGGTLSGFVYEEDGSTPIQGAHVSAFGQLPSGRLVGHGTDTEADGSYRITDLLATTYWIVVQKPGFAIEFYDSKHVVETANRVTVEEGNETSGINFTLESGELLTFYVYEEDGETPIRDVSFFVSTSVGESAGAWGATGRDGKYEMWLAAGSYLLQTDLSSIPGYVSEWYQDQYEISSATLVQVVASQENSIEFLLARAGIVSGYVYEEDGTTPIGGATVYAFPVTGNHPGAGANTDSDGSYQIEGLPTGSYVVQATVSDHEPQFYSFAGDEGSALEVLVDAPEDTSGIDFALALESQ
jgi:hypothetical protein